MTFTCNQVCAPLLSGYFKFNAVRGCCALLRLKRSEKGLSCALEATSPRSTISSQRVGFAASTSISLAPSDELHPPLNYTSDLLRETSFAQNIHHQVRTYSTAPGPLSRATQWLQALLHLHSYCSKSIPRPVTLSTRQRSYYTAPV